MKKVLIIEDEPDIAVTEKKIVERAGYSVEYALDPLDGLKIAKGFDLIILDLLMPGMSGQEVLAELKRRKIKTPVIIVSASGASGDLEIRSKYPGVGTVSKTRIIEDLVEQIRAKIGK